MKKFDSPLQEAEYKAIDSLSRYKFIMFGYWAAIWVHYAKHMKPKPANPFRIIVNTAKQIKNTNMEVNHENKY